MVQVFAGLDIVKHVIAWEFQTLDPNTGDNSLNSFDFLTRQPIRHVVHVSLPIRLFIQLNRMP